MCEMWFSSRGHLCEICGNDEIIYPWDASAISCPECSTVYHRVCWAKRNHNCPKCSRIEKRRILLEQNTIDPENIGNDNDTHRPNLSN